jgi:hypothetical protein
MGFDSVHSSSSSNNLVSGGPAGAYALMAGPAAAGGLLSPESSYLADYTAAQYAHDGLDIPGTAQVCVCMHACRFTPQQTPARRHREIGAQGQHMRTFALALASM